MLYAHGGGFMVGKSEDTDFITRKLASLNQILVVSVNYRLAPEFPFPIGLNDFYTVFRWLQEHGAELNGDPQRIVVSGDSSGSNFAAVIPLKAKDEGESPPAAVVLFGPVLDMNFEKYSSFNQFAPLGVVYDTAFMGFLRGAYVPQPDCWNHPYASPFLGDLSDYPPIMLIVGTEDPVVDSTKAFAEKHQQLSSHECWLYICKGMPHGFYFFPHLFPEEEQAYRDVQQFLSRQLDKNESKS
jgi:acetyl esterase